MLAYANYIVKGNSWVLSKKTPRPGNGRGGGDQVRARGSAGSQRWEPGGRFFYCQQATARGRVLPGRRPDGLWNRRNFPRCGIPGGWGRKKRPFAGRRKGRAGLRHPENGRRDPPERLYCRRRAGGFPGRRRPALPSDNNRRGRFCHPAAGSGAVFRSGAGSPAKGQSFFFSVSFSNFCMLRNLARQES